MNPFFFGSADRALYGTYHPPRVRGGGQEGVVLCPPFGVEYMRSHRAFRQLTTLLTRAGRHVLRFDYGGTGDSVGDGFDESLDAWRADIRTAVEELRDTAGLGRVTLVGLRLGGALALGAAGDEPGVNRVVLWDPVVDGASWLREILPAGPPEASGGMKGAVGVSGFPLSRGMLNELCGFRLGAGNLSPSCRVDVVVSHANPAFDALRERLVAAGVTCEAHLVPSEGNWAEGDAFGSALLPQGIIQHIVELLTGSGAVVR